MADYTVDVNNPAEPTRDRNAKQGSDEIKALKALVASLVIASSASASPRQTIISSSLDSSGYNNAIAAGAGLRVGLTANADDPYQLSFANGFSGGKAINSEESLTANVADITAADLAASNINFLYRDFGVGWGKTLVPPQYGYAFDRGQGSILHFEEAVTPLDDFGNIYSITGATLNAAKPAYGARTMDLSGGVAGTTNVKRCESTDIIAIGPDPWEVSSVVFFDVAPSGAGVNHWFMSGVNATGQGYRIGWGVSAGVKACIALSSDGTTDNITAATFGVTNLVINTWYRFRFIFTGTEYRLYVASGGSGATPVWTPEVLEKTVVSSSSICALTRVIWGCYSTSTGNYSNGMSGYMDEARLIRCATSTAAVTPDTAPDTYPFSITQHPYHFFSIPKMKMYEITAASTVAGQNPTLTARTRLFVGEADTDATAVTAVRNYAIRGESWIRGNASAVSSTLTLNHNIGVPPLQSCGFIRIKNSILGYAVEELQPIGSQFDNGTDANTLSVARNNGYWSAGANGITTVSTKNTGARNVIGDSNVLLDFYFKRGW